MKVLVGYASAHGSTAEIAAFMAKELEQRDFEVSVANVADVRSISEYDGCILGSAIHGGMWLSEMSQFLTRFADELRHKPSAFFITCIRVMEPGGYQHSLSDYINHKVLDDLNITERVAFAGRLDMNDVDWNERWTLAARYDGKHLPGAFNNDYRDWDKIRHWTRTFADQLLPA